jgi:DNA (cytosine-5)-methyltransferase 1
MTVEGGKVFAEICKKIREPKKGLKYTLSVLRLDAVDYGVPQFRDRVFIIGSRNAKTIAQIPKITSKPGIRQFEGQRSWRTVRDALRGLPSIRTEPPANHTGRDHSQRIIERYASMRPGERDHFTRINKLDLDRPSFTIIVGSDKGGGKGHIHPTEPREVTPRESARIQTFPDWWAFAGTVRHPIRQIGNAVPPLLAAAVGNAIRSQIFGLEPVPFKTILQVIDQNHLFQEGK